MSVSKPAYVIKNKLPIAQSPDVRVTLMTFEPGQEIPWHTHSTVTDTSFCLEGEVELSLKGPERSERLTCGQWRQVPPGHAHRVRCLGPGECRVLLVQGEGEYDFMPA